MLISNKIHYFRNFTRQTYIKIVDLYTRPIRKKQFFRGIITISYHLLTLTLYMSMST